MNPMDLISVIVPVYKVEAYLDRCVQSIVDQTYANLDIILVDDGSPDRCPQMCDKWAKRDNRIRVIHKENGGLSDARNAGMQAASGTYIAFVDSDDWLELRCIEYLYQTAEINDCEIVGCAFRMTDGTNQEPVKPQYHVRRIVDRETAVSDLIDDKIRQVVWNKLYKRALIESIPFEKGKCHEDEFWSYQVLGRITRYAEIDYAGYNYFQRADSIMGRTYALQRLDVLEAKTQRQTYLRQNLPQLADKGQINLFFTCIYHAQLALKYLNAQDRKQAFVLLKNTSRTWRLSASQKKTLKFTHQMWAWMAEVSLETACRVRNMLKVGL